MVCAGKLCVDLQALDARNAGEGVLDFVLQLGGEDSPRIIELGRILS